MKYLPILAVIGLISAATGACASPYLVCDPQAGVEYYTITGDPFFVSPKTAEADGSIRYDLAGIPTGAHTIAVAACNVWGCSSATSFSFTKAAAGAPVRIRIIVGP